MTAGGFKSYLELVEAWQVNHKVGLSILQSLQSCLSQVVPSSVKSKHNATLDAIRTLAPSPALSAYLAGVPVGGSNGRTVFELQDNYIMIQNCATTALNISIDLRQAARLVSTAALGHLKAESEAAVRDQHLREPAPASETELLDDGEWAFQNPSCSSGMQQQQQQQQQEQQQEQQQQQETGGLEVSLMMAALAAAVTKQSDMMGKIAAAITLETPLDEVLTYVHMWELAPFISDQLVADVFKHLADCG